MAVATPVAHPPAARPVSTAPAGTTASGERQFFAFLRRELAPSPARWRATLCLVMTCEVATSLIISFHIPDGEYLIITLFVVSQSDARASLTRAWLRVVATVLGGVLAILALIAGGDQPWILFPLHALMIAVALFLCRTTTAPYAFLLGGATFFLVVPELIAVPGANLAKGLWRILLTAAGAVLGTTAQVSLWPDDPEELLLQDLAARLRREDPGPRGRRTCRSAWQGECAASDERHGCRWRASSICSIMRRR